MAMKYEEELLPVTEETGANGQELVLRFEYKAMPKNTPDSKQEKLLADAINTILNDATVKSRWLALSQREPTEKNPHRTLLEKHLTQYTTRNTADYFIHKDLGRFLRNELDFYIKNEVMHLDDVQHAEKFADIERNLRLIQTLRAIALDLIAFLAQLEDFQKKLWLKKKFVVATHYCITLDRVPESLYPTIAANAKQREQWEKLGMLGEHKTDLFNQVKTGSVEYLKAHPYLMADTALYDAEFKQALLAAMDNLDDSLDGLLIHGDNFQALNLLQERYREQVKCVHIDPPYNTGSSGFLYKNAYPHSSWLSMIKDRVNVSVSLLADLGVFACHIDEFEMERLHLLLEKEASLENAGTLVWDKGMPIAGANGLATQHEYVVFRTKGKAAIRVKKKNIEVIHSKINELLAEHGTVSKAAIAAYRKWLKAQKHLTKSEMTYDQFDDTGKAFRSDNMSATDRRANDKFYTPLKHPHTNKNCPVPEYGWRYTPDSLSNLNADGLILFGEDESVMPRKKTYLENTTDSQMSTIFRSGSRGKVILDSLGFEFSFAHSVDFYNYIIDASVNRKDLVLDFFAGSGTTGHAVINLNREDNGKRKYILVEQGEYFDTVLKPRIQKVVYSADWKDGKAMAPETGISHAFKVLKLESYEDTLNNLQLRRNEAQQSLLDSLSPSTQEDYLLRYMLDIESRDSLLSVEQFHKPFECALKVTVDSAGAYEERTIDLVETFNYLIGLRVKHIDMQREQGFVAVTGWLPSGEKTLVLWRDMERVDYEQLNRLCGKLAINPADSEFDVVYINGDHNIPAVFTSTEAEGGITKTLKIHQIEAEFLSRMFAVDGVS
jgi:adenine-specific DNA-methyltransferase